MDTNNQICNDIMVNYASFATENENEKGSIVILHYVGSGDPRASLNTAINILSENEDYLELIDARLDNPWIRVLVTKVNEMKRENLDPEKHTLKALEKV